MVQCIQSHSHLMESCMPQAQKMVLPHLLPNQIHIDVVFVASGSDQTVFLRFDWVWDLL